MKFPGAAIAAHKHNTKLTINSITTCTLPNTLDQSLPHHNIPTIIPQMEPRKGDVCTTLPLYYEGREVVSNTPSAQAIISKIKHVKIIL